MHFDTPIPVLLDATSTPLTDEDLIARILAGEPDLFEVVIRRHNQQLYRAARAITRDEAEVEDILQQAYLNAFAHLHQFESRARLSTWLTRIVINEAHARRRRVGHGAYLPTAAADGGADGVVCPQPGPEQQAYAGELERVLEAAVDELPEPYRVVFMLRDVDGMSTIETGAALGLGSDAVKTRLHRARAMLRRALAIRVGALAAGAFRFHAPRCDRVVAAVFAQLGAAHASAAGLAQERALAAKSPAGS
jgi:RNA polymerase sigma-70 factor (ECF subfamily)